MHFRAPEKLRNLLYSAVHSCAAFPHYVGFNMFWHKR